MPPGRFLRGATGSSSRPGHVAGVGLHARPRELGTQARPTDSLGRWGAEKEMKDGERETSKRGGEEGRGSIWKITAVSWLWLLQSRDESSAGCLGNGYFPPAADQFHLHKCPLKL